LEMSLTTISPLIRDWIRLGLEWTYHWQPKVRPFTLNPGEEVQVPQAGYTFKAPEGVLLTFAASFDHPKCGIRLESPQLDTRDIFTVENIAFIGTVNMPFFVFAMTPPHTSHYMVFNYKEWAWTEWARLYVFNADTEPHTCLGYAYTMATLREPRPLDLETVGLLKLAWEICPEDRRRIREILEREVKRWIRHLESKISLRG